MKAGDTYVANTPDDPRGHGKKFTMLRSEERVSGISAAGNVMTTYWLGRADDGTELWWAEAHFDDGTVKKSK